MEIDPQSRLPLHVQIEGALESAIANGTWKPGSRLPSEDALIERFAVSRTTVRSAIQSLIARGQIEILRGKGTFVVRPQITQELCELTGFMEDMESLAREASSRILDRRIVAASETVARQLALVRGAALTRIQRVRLADVVPVSFDEIYLSQQGQTIDSDDLEQHAIFSLLEHKYAARLLEAEYRLSAVAAHGTAAKALGIDAESQIYLIERTTYAEDFQPVYYERLYYRGEQVRFVTRLSRRSRVKIGAG